MKFIPTIGLEIHAQLNTSRKMFAPEAVTYGAIPNTVVSEVTLALPGTLPIPNNEAIKKLLQMAIACKCNISDRIIFHRKNYFYPDLPKGYQITEGEDCLCKNGYVTVMNKSGDENKVYLSRIHIEEDTGKSIHDNDYGDTYLDFNRAGSPLIEIVTEPCIHSSEDAYLFLQEIRKIVRYLDVCDGNMEEGSLRCDVNISISKEGEKKLGDRVEIKNLNSFKAVRDAIEYEIQRHASIIENGGTIENETRQFNYEEGKTVVMRQKDSASDYRYFPEPNIPPVLISKDYIEKIKSEMPLLPQDYYKKYTEDFGLSPYDSLILTSSREFIEYFEATCLQSTSHTSYKTIANFIIGPLQKLAKEQLISLMEIKISYQSLAELAEMVYNNIISFSIASQVLLEKIIENPTKTPLELAKEYNLIQQQFDEELVQSKIAEVIDEYKNKVIEYKSGKVGLMELFVGQVIKKTKNQFPPDQVRNAVKNTVDKFEINS